MHIFLLLELWINITKNNRAASLRSMTNINTVLGPLDTNQLGVTLMHEHIMCALPGINRDYPEILGDKYLDIIVTELSNTKKGGTDTIIDATTFDLGRDVYLLTEASRRSGVNIITCTGWYSDPLFLTGIVTIDQFARLFIREIREGINGTNIKAGILKAAANSDGMKPGREVILRAVARAHLQTGAPILLHSSAPEQIGRQQIVVLREEGVNLNRVKIDHCLDTDDQEYLIWLLEQGCFVGMDPFPGVSGNPEKRIRMIKDLIDCGWKHRLLLSQDRIIVLAHTHIPFEVKLEVDRKNPYGLLYIKEVVIPKLKEMGIEEKVIKMLCIDNPRDFLTGI